MSSSPGPDLDRDVLISLFRSTGGLSWFRKGNWDVENAPLAMWHGVQVNEKGQVVQLQLDNNNLQGVIPPELGNLMSLRLLDLRKNSLSGRIPEQLAKLPGLKMFLDNGDQPGVAAPEVELPVLQQCCVRSLYLADQPRADLPLHMVVTAQKSRLSFMLVRLLKHAIFGEVWEAIEVELRKCTTGDPGGLDFTAVREGGDHHGRRFAVKMMPWTTIRARNNILENPLHEIAISAKLQDPGHPSLLPLVAALDDGKTVYKVTPYVSGGELFDWVADAHLSPPPETRIRRLFRQIVEGLAYIHSEGICYADMSLENVVIDEVRENVFILDSGMAFQMPVGVDGQRMMSLPDGRRAKKSYCAPETSKGRQPYDAVKVDVFAAGCMLFMMLTGMPPFSEATRLDPKFRKVVYRGDMQGLLRDYGRPPLSVQAADLLRKMMAYRAEDRPLAEEVLEHPWFGSPTKIGVGMPLPALDETPPLGRPFTQRASYPSPTVPTVPETSTTVTPDPPAHDGDAPGSSSTEVVPSRGYTGRGVLCQRWREESNRVEVKVAPSNQKDIEEVRRLPEYETATISQSRCIIEPVLRGPTGATFSPGTASIRYYVGQYDEGSKSVSRAEIEDDILDNSFPVVKADGPGRRWEADGSFTVVWQGNELWLETELEHFCDKGLATKANTNFFKRMANHLRRDSSRTPPSTPAPGVTPSTSGSPNISSSALDKMVTAGPLSSDFHRAGWIEVRNWTKECLGVTLAAETVPTDEAQSRAKSGNASLGLYGTGLSGGGSAEGSSSVTRQPAPFFFGLTTHWVDPGKTRPIELPGGVQSRYMWISVSKDITPEDLGVQNTEGWGLGPSSVTEDMLGSFGYSVYGGFVSRMMDGLFQRKKFFQENASPATLHRTLVGIRVWEKGSISPGQFTAVLAGDLTRRCFWQAWIPSGRNFEDSLKEYLETNVVAPRR